MGSPISSWENVEAYFTGYGGFTPGLVLLISVVVCVGVLVIGQRHESHSYNKLED